MKTQYLLAIILLMIIDQTSQEEQQKKNKIDSILINNDLNTNRLNNNNWFIKSNTLTQVYLIGSSRQFETNDLIAFSISNNTKKNTTDNNICLPYLNQTFNLEILKLDRNSIAQTSIRLSDAYDTYDLCFKATNKTYFIHQNIQIFIQKQTVPVWLQILISIIGILLSFYLSGLALGIMSIDITDLMILIKEGTPTQMRYAEVLLPIRRDGNRLLSTILLSNVAANSMVTVFLGDLLANGWQTFIISTLTLCIIGEIVPQALFNRHGFILAAKSIYFIRFLLFATLPFSYPIGLALDAALGDEAGSAYTRKQIRYLIQLQYEKGNLKLHETELNILQSALTISKIRVDFIMTDLSKVFMLNINSNLDFKTLSMIIKSGYTRIPLYHNDRSNIVGVINAKDLSLINPNDNLPVETFCSYYNTNLLFVPNDTSIIKMLQEFIKGKTHLAFVYNRGIRIVKETTTDTDENIDNKSINKLTEKNDREISDDTLLDNLLLSSTSSMKSDEMNSRVAVVVGAAEKRLSNSNNKRKTILKMGSLGDSGIFMVSSNEETDILNAAVKKIIGIVTLEDIFAMIIQQEIFDEKDLDLTTMKSNHLRDFTYFASKHNEQKMPICEQTLVATFQFLSANLTPFSSKYLSKLNLQHILKQSNTIESFTPTKENNYELKVYKQNVKSNFFILIISGNGEVIIGRENFKYTTHAFSYFGLQAILGDNETKKDLLNEQTTTKDLNYLPDYCLTFREKCIYMKLTRQAYLKAVRNNEKTTNDLQQELILTNNSNHNNNNNNESLHKSSNIKRLSLKKIDNRKLLKKNLSVQNFQS